jgi:hypothetical protein
MENDALMVNSAPGLQDRLELGVAHEDFDWGAVEDQAGVLMEALPGAKLTKAQAEEVLRWHKGQMDAAAKREVAGVLLRTLMELLNSANMRLDVYCMAMVAGVTDGLGYSSQDDVAQLLKTSRSNVSKCVRRWTAIFKIQTLRFKRTDENRKHCSDAQTQNHWRNRSIDDLAG